MKATLWTKNFTIITVGTIISSIGGVAMNFALSFVVFDASGSTWLSSVFSAVSLLPAFILPIVIAPYIDCLPRKPFIVGLDACSGILYLLFAVYIAYFGFQYSLYLLFSVCVTSIGTIYQLAYTSLYPNLIPKGYTQKGYSISSMIYPTANIITTPIAAILYQKFGLSVICILEGCLLLIVAVLETQIHIQEKVQKVKKLTFQKYLTDLKEGIHFLKKEKGVQRIFAYMACTQGKAEGSSSLIIAHFQTSSALGVTLYSVFTIVEFIGRSFGGILQYRFLIPEKKRFIFAYFVYVVYACMDATLLWIAYPFMLLNRMICGFLGIQSAVLRESSMQKYIPDEKRAKINAFFQTLVSLSSICMRLLIGWLGEIMPYAVAFTLVAFLDLMLGYMLIYRGRQEIMPIYNQVQ